MKNQKYLDQMIGAGWEVKNIDPRGNVRFYNIHSVGHPGSNFEPDFFWVDNADLKELAHTELIK